MAANANPKHPWLYLAGHSSNNVLIYDLAEFGVPQVGAITAGINEPTRIFVDPAGTLYVANESTGNVTIYPAGATAPSLTLSQNLSEPESVAVDGQGNVWVANDGTQPSIVIYPPGQTTPSQTITDSLIVVPTQLTFDASGNAFFGDNATGVSEIPAGSTQPISLGLKKLIPNSTNGLAVDPRNDMLFVSFGNLHNRLNVYVAGHTRPKDLLSTPTADSLAVGSLSNHEDLFVPGSQTNIVTVYRDGSTSPLTSFPVGTQYTTGVAFKPAGVP